MVFRNLKTTAKAAPTKPDRLGLGSARPLFSGHRFNEQFSFLFGVKGNFRALFGNSNERQDFRFVKNPRGGQSYVANEIAVTLKAFGGIGKALALQKAEAHVARRQGKRKDGQAGLFSGAKADDKEIVIVVNHFDSAGKEFTELDEIALGLANDGWFVFSEEFFQLFCSGHGPHPVRIMQESIYHVPTYSCENSWESVQPQAL